MTIVHVDFLDLDLGFVSLSSGQVCDIVGYFDVEGDAIDVDALLSEAELVDAEGGDGDALLPDADMVGGVTFELPSGELFALSLNRFHSPTVH